MKSSFKNLKSSVKNLWDEESKIDKDSAIMTNHFQKIAEKAEKFKETKIEGTINEATSCLTLDNNLIFIDNDTINVYGLIAKKVVIFKKLDLF